MEKEHRELIRTNYRVLGREYSTAIDDVCDNLYEKKIFSEHMRQDILAQNTPLNRGYRFLDLIAKRGPKAFEALYQASLEETLYVACDVLKPDKSPHEPKEDDSSSSDLQSDAVENPPEDEAQGGDWPSEAYKTVLKTNSLEVLSVENGKRDYEKRIQSEDVYPMKSKPRGYPLLVYDEKKPLKSDRLYIQNLFEGLEFESLKLKKVENEQDVKNLSSEKAFSEDCDCFVLIIIAKGSHGYLNSEGLDLIKKEMKESSKLSKKPKLIFHLTLGPDISEIVTAKDDPGRGTRQVVPDDNKENPMYSNGENINSLLRMRRPVSLEHNVEDEKSLGGDRTDGPIPKSKNTNSLQKESPVETERSTVDSHDGPIQEDMTPKDSETCFIKATEYGCEVMTIVIEEEEIKITRFFHLIVDIFSKKAKILDLTELLGEVNRETGKTVATYKRSLRRKLYFFPGFSQS